MGAAERALLNIGQWLPEGMGANCEKRAVLFLCLRNSCRSQMAEGWARTLWHGEIEPYSAGVAPSALDPRAVAVMREAGIDISSHRPKHLRELRHVPVHCVVTLCDEAREACPAPLAAKVVLHRSFDDPAALAAQAPSEAHALAHYRRVRDELRAFVERFPEILCGEG